MSSKLGFSSWLYQPDEYVRLGVEGRLDVEETLPRLGGREKWVGLIVELDELRLRGGGDVIVVVIDMVLAFGMAKAQTSRSFAALPEVTRQRVFI